MLSTTAKEGGGEETRSAAVVVLDVVWRMKILKSSNQCLLSPFPCPPFVQFTCNNSVWLRIRSRGTKFARAICSPSLRFRFTPHHGCQLDGREQVGDPPADLSSSVYSDHVLFARHIPNAKARGYYAQPYVSARRGHPPALVDRTPAVPTSFYDSLPHSAEQDEDCSLDRLRCKVDLEQARQSLLKRPNWTAFPSAAPRIRDRRPRKRVSQNNAYARLQSGRGDKLLLLKSPERPLTSSPEKKRSPLSLVPGSSSPITSSDAASHQHSSSRGAAKASSPKRLSTPPSHAKASSNIKTPRKLTKGSSHVSSPVPHLSASHCQDE